jgi:hypothetical protein
MFFACGLQAAWPPGRVACSQSPAICKWYIWNCYVHVSFRETGEEFAKKFYLFKAIIDIDGKL